MATSGKIVKMEVDFSDTVDKKLPEYQELAQVHIYNYTRACKNIEVVHNLHL